MRILIDVRIEPGFDGGIEALVIGMACGFREIQDIVTHKFVFLCRNGGSEYLRPYVGGNVEILEEEFAYSGFFYGIRTCIRKFFPICGIFLREFGLRKPGRQLMELQVLPNITFKFHFDLIHSLNPMLPITDPRPQVLTVHDFQHHHLPELFSKEVVQWRETVHPQHFKVVKKIVAISQFTANELHKIYGVPKTKIQMIHWGAPVCTYKEISVMEKIKVVKKYDLETPYLIYPSLTYAHKNHLNLLKAVHWLKNIKGIKVRVICTGAKKLIWPVIEKQLCNLGLNNDIIFTGFLATPEMRVVFENAKGLIFPSLYEGFGLGIVEALSLGKPIACSNLPVFHEIAGDAPIYFDPRNPEEIALAMLQILGTSDKFKMLSQLSRKEGLRFEWAKVARDYVSVYENSV